MDDHDHFALLHATLDLHPDDQVSRGVLADLYGESGDAVAAEALRWLVERDRRPFRTMMERTFCWLSYEDKECDLYAGPWQPISVTKSWLPMFVWKKLAGCISSTKEIVLNNFWKDYKMRRQAEDAFIEAYRSLTDAERAALWEGVIHE